MASRSTSTTADLSYGLYIYHWPVQFVLVLAGAAALGPWAFVPLSIAVALVLAALSWVLVEAPALRCKDARWVDRLILKGVRTTPRRPGWWTGPTGQRCSRAAGRPAGRGER